MTIRDFFPGKIPSFIIFIYLLACMIAGNSIIDNELKQVLSLTPSD